MSTVIIKIGKYFSIFSIAQTTFFVNTYKFPYICIWEAKRIYFHYIKINDGLYLYSVIEYTMRLPLENQDGGELFVLVNTQSMRFVGRTFGLDAQENAGHDIVDVSGRFGDITDEMESFLYPINNM